MRPKKVHEDVATSSNSKFSFDTEETDTMRPRELNEDLSSSFDAEEKLYARHSDRDMLRKYSQSGVRTPQAICRQSQPIGNRGHDSHPTVLSEQVLRSLPKAASASCIRSRFLNSLGFSKAAEDHVLRNQEASPSRSRSRPLLHKRSDSFSEQLKADHGLLDESMESGSYSSTASTCSSVRSGRRRSISFDDRVTVHPIPSRSSYSERIRNSLWTPPLEMQRMAARNCVEFAAENWDWRQVMDEKDMVVFEGELVHPIHFVRECSLRRHFFQVMSAQQQEQA